MRFDADLRMIMSGIFISYRREDSGGYAGRVSEWLGKHFGKQMIFPSGSLIYTAFGVSRL